MAATGDGGRRGEGAPKAPKPPVFIAGDPIRGVGAVLVVAYHVVLAVAVEKGTSFGQTPFTLTFGRLGSYAEDSGVLALYGFFILSAYLITRPFVWAFLRGDPVPSLAPYVRNRVLRIVPAFWVVFTLILIFYGPKDAELIDIVSVYGFAQNFRFDAEIIQSLLAPGWSVGVEVIFYLCVPVVAAGLTWAFARSRYSTRLGIVLALSAVVAAGSLIVREAVPEDPQDWRWFWTNAFVFMPGIVFAALELRGQEAMRRRPDLARYLALGLVAAGVAFFILFVQTDTFAYGAEGGIAALCTMCLVGAPLVLQWGTGSCWRVLDNRVLSWIGQRSYSIYLMHVAILIQTAKVPNGSFRYQVVVTWLLTMAVVLPLSELSFRFVEQPFLRRKSRASPTTPAEDLPLAPQAEGQKTS
jgi:peptidoglycan/LPS O-acetylase OafA/YrhL